MTDKPTPTNSTLRELAEAGLIFFENDDENLVSCSDDIVTLLDERDKLAGEVEQLNRMIKMSGKAGMALSEATIEGVEQSTTLRTPLSEAQAEIADLTQAVQLAEEDILLMMTERNEAQAERDAAYEALEPFGDEAVMWPRELRDTFRPVIGHPQDAKFADARLTLGHLRKAARLIQSKEGAQDAS